MFKDTTPDNIKDSVRYHFAYSILGRNDMATDSEFRNYFGYFYDTDNFWLNTYTYLIRYDLQKKKITYDATDKFNQIAAAIEEDVDKKYQIIQINPVLYKVYCKGRFVYCYGLTPDKKIFFCEDEQYIEIRYLPIFEDLLSLIYAFHEEYSFN